MSVDSVYGIVNVSVVVAHVLGSVLGSGRVTVQVHGAKLTKDLLRWDQVFLQQRVIQF